MKLSMASKLDSLPANKYHILTTSLVDVSHKLDMSLTQTEATFH